MHERTHALSMQILFVNLKVDLIFSRTAYSRRKFADATSCLQLAWERDFAECNDQQIFNEVLIGREFPPANKLRFLILSAWIIAFKSSVCFWFPKCKGAYMLYQVIIKNFFINEVLWSILNEWFKCCVQLYNELILPFKLWFD